MGAIARSFAASPFRGLACLTRRSARLAALGGHRLAGFLTSVADWIEGG